MIGYLSGEVIASDGVYTIVKTASGIGHQVYFSGRLMPGDQVAWYTSMVVRENGHFLYAFPHLRDKKLFEALIEIKGVGPKSAYTLWAKLGFEQTLAALRGEDKKKLTRAPGIGPKAAAQILLELGPKSDKLAKLLADGNIPLAMANPSPSVSPVDDGQTTPVVSDALMAFKELGFREERVQPIIQRLMQEEHGRGQAGSPITKAEQLVQLVLKEL